MRASSTGGTPLSNSAFRRAWIGFTLSAAGDAASWIALVVLCLGPANGSLTVLAVLYTVPVAIGGLCAGWALDRFDRRRLIIADSLARAALFASIPVAMAFGPPAAVQLYVVAAGYGLLKMISLAGFPTLIPSLVPSGQLAQANALEVMSFGLASLCGAMMAGVGVVLVGAVWVIAIDAVTYLALAVALLSIRPSRQIQEPSRKRPRGDRSGLSGVVRFVVANPVLRTTTIMFAMFNIGEGCLLVFLPHRAVDLGLGSASYGYLVAATTAGQVIATAVLLRRTWRRSLRISIFVAQLAAATVVIALAVPSTATTLATLILLGLLTAPMTAWAQTLRMRIVPAAEHGRLFALLRTAMQATPPLGAGLAGLLLPHGPAATVLVVAAVMGLPALLLAPSLLGAKAAGSHDAEQPAPTDVTDSV